MPLQESQRLERTAREVAFGRPKGSDIRAAVRDLTLTALRRRVLTLPHLADVASAIGNGIQPAPSDDRGTTTIRRALEGLREGMTRALTALDLASREYVSIGGRMSGEELQRWMMAMESLPEIGDEEIAKLLESLRETLASAVSAEISEGTHELGLLASGALLGLGVRPLKGT
jgi:hypothetical protein